MAPPKFADLLGCKARFRADRNARLPNGKVNYLAGDHAQREDRYRIRNLKNTEGLSPLEAVQALDLAERMSRAIEAGEAPDTLASAECYRQLTIPIIGHLWEAVEAYGPENVALVTLRPHGMLVEGRELSSLDPARFKKKWQNDFDRAGITRAPGFAFMGLDADFDANRGDGGLVDFHGHGIVGGDKLDALEALRGRPSYLHRRVHPLEQGLPESSRVIIQKGLFDLPTPIAYCLNWWVPHRPTTLLPDDTLDRSKTKRRIPSPYLQRWLLWMDRWSLDDLVLRNGLEMTRSGFKIAPRR